MQRHELQKALRSYGLEPSVNCDPERLHDLPTERLQSIACWVVVLDDEEAECEALSRLIEESDTPILFGLGKAPQQHDESYISWERRLLGKLEEQLGRLEILDSEDSLVALEALSDIDSEPKALKDVASLSPVADQVWVLAASLGGPAAVKEFLDAVPEGIKAGFLYAQHIDAHFSKVLTRVLGRDSALNLRAIQTGDRIHEGEVLVVPVDNETSFGSSGAHIRENAWSGPYGPSIDHLLANLHAYYGDRCHVIVFSGMGNDGALTAPKMRRSGCHVWAQTPESCANGSMPQSIIDLGCAERYGTPSELAQAFITMVGCRAES